ncbi:MAG: type I glyceraldehyde-3-phosphate dehydrogenase [Acidobacteria bacterium]|nr:type I glyceraldehyde-3-phosphate dehydrogenase [Acidobacteriota bacterium]
MPVSFAINGLGRIGRALLRIAETRPTLELVAVNDLGSVAQLAHLVAHDSLHGPFAGHVAVEGNAMRINGRRVTAFCLAQPADVPWQESRATVVVDATGLCKTRELAGEHLRPGIERVIVSANADVDVTICIGVNDGAYDPARHRLLSAASCTTNCLAPLAYLLHREYGITRGMLNTVHSYNNDQRLLDYPHPDMRRARAAGLNMIPTTTSAIQALGRVLPELAGRLAGLAIRVPTPNVSLVDLVVELERSADAAAVNDLFRRAAADELAGILAVEEEELVSSDFLRRPHSAIIDLALTQSLGDHLVRVVAWYDNEWGHACRLADMLELVGAGAESAS